MLRLSRAYKHESEKFFCEVVFLFFNNLGGLSMSKWSFSRRGLLRGIGVLALSTCVTSFAAEPTKKDATEIVAKAASYFKANGREKTIEAINAKDSEFRKGELYVFAYDMTGTTVAHPVNPKLIGKNLIEVPDPDGKFFRKDIMELAKTKGSGWVDYKFKNPESGKVESKTSFVQAANGLVFVAGIYKD